MRMRKKFMMITIKNDFFFTCRTRTEHFNLLEIISKNSEAYFHFFLMDTKKHGEMGRNGAVRIKSNQNQNQIKNLV